MSVRALEGSQDERQAQYDIHTLFSRKVYEQAYLLLLLTTVLTISV
jgi:hypothetical protein